MKTNIMKPVIGLSQFSHVYHTVEVIGPGGFACATRGGIAMRSWPLLLPTFALSSSMSIAFDPLRETPEAEILFRPIYFAITRKKEK